MQANYQAILASAVKRTKEHGYRPESGEAVAEWHGKEVRNYAEALYLIGALLDMMTEEREKK